MHPINSLKKMIEDKKVWRQHEKEVAKLPRDYQIVYKEVEKYLFNFAAGSGTDTIEGIYGLLEFLKEGAEAGIPVLEYVGEDVGEFAESYRASLKTKSWVDDPKKKAEKNVAKKLAELEKEK